MKIAICISGQMRTYKKCCDQMLTRFKEFNPDIFIYTWRQNGKSARGGEENNEDITYDELNRLYKPKGVVIEEYKNSYLYELEGVTYPESIKKKSVETKSVTSIPMFYTMYKCNNLRKKYNKNYDIVIRIRPDLILPSDINYRTIFNMIIENGENVFITDQFNHFQFSDRLFISNPEHNDYYCSIFSKLNGYWEFPIRNNVMLVGERLMKFHMDQYNKKLNVHKLETQILR